MNTDTTSAEYFAFLQGRYRGGRHYYLSHVLYPQFLSMLKPVADRTIWDFGCGNGEFLDFCRRRRIDAAGIDSNALMVKECVSRGLRVCEGSVVDFRPARPVERLVCDNVLEHLEFPSIDEFFGNLARVASPDCVALLVVPGRAGFRRDPTHRTFVDATMIEMLCHRHGFVLWQSRFSPLNIPSLGSVFYLNMSVFSVALAPVSSAVSGVGSISDGLPV